MSKNKLIYESECLKKINSLTLTTSLEQTLERKNFSKSLDVVW